jgi:hypothetical protein
MYGDSQSEAIRLGGGPDSIQDLTASFLPSSYQYIEVATNNKSSYIERDRLKCGSIDALRFDFWAQEPT